jgi:cell division septation protein DedD
MSMVRRDVDAGGRRGAERDALTSHPRVERLLDAARAPASPRELARENDAVDLFHRAHLSAPVSAPLSPPLSADRTGSHAEPTRSWWTGFRAAAASVAAVLAMSSGVAFATTGHLPFAGPLRQLTGQGSAGHSHDALVRRRGASPEGDVGAPSSVPTQALQGLCVAYHRGQKASHGHALETRPFAGLLAAAGGADHVDGFCASLPPRGNTSAHPTPSSATHPGEPTHDVTRSAGPTTHPTQEPTSHPTRAPSPTLATHPTGRTRSAHPSPAASLHPGT